MNVGTLNSQPRCVVQIPRDLLDDADDSGSDEEWKPDPHSLRNRLARLAAMEA